jgi:hypothetical protein
MPFERARTVLVFGTASPEARQATRGRGGRSDAASSCPTSVCNPGCGLTTALASDPGDAAVGGRPAPAGGRGCDARVASGVMRTALCDDRAANRSAPTRWTLYWRMKRRFGVLDWDLSARTSQGVELAMRLTTSHSVEPSWKDWLGAGRQPSQCDSVVRAAVTEAVTSVVAGITVERIIDGRADFQQKVLAMANECLIGQPCRVELISLISFSDTQGYIANLAKRSEASRGQEPSTDS